MITDDLEYHQDGKRYVGHLALPDGDHTVAGVLVCHEGPGLDDHAKDVAHRLAGLGYAAFALDYHGDGVPVPLAEVRARLTPLRDSPELTRAVGRAGLDQLTAQSRVDASRVAAIGFCFGGTMALELARDGAALRAVVGFHSGLATTAPAAPGAIQGSILACIGADDPMIPVDQRNAFEDEMRTAGADWRLQVYGGAVHSFTNRAADAMGVPAIRYHEPTDRRSWHAMVELFDETLQG
jgi:dienelactone hydrolase